jgi:hypothetical protein
MKFRVQKLEFRIHCEFAGNVDAVFMGLRDAYRGILRVGGPTAGERVASAAADHRRDADATAA